MSLFTNDVEACTFLRVAVISTRDYLKIGPGEHFFMEEWEGSSGIAQAGQE